MRCHGLLDEFHGLVNLWHELFSALVFSDFKAPMMDKLITHVPAADVEDSFTALALTWPLWESRTHPQVSFVVLVLLGPTEGVAVVLINWERMSTHLKLTLVLCRILPKAASSTLTTTGTTRLSAS